MSLLIRIIMGFIGAGFGFVLVRYSDWFYYNFGSISWAERYIRFFGGTRLVIKLLGILVIFFSFLLATGLLGGFLEVLLSPLTKY